MTTLTSADYHDFYSLLASNHEVFLADGGVLIPDQAHELLTECHVQIRSDLNLLTAPKDPLPAYSLFTNDLFVLGDDLRSTFFSAVRHRPLKLYRAYRLERNEPHDNYLISAYSGRPPMQLISRFAPFALTLLPVEVVLK